MSEVIDGVHFYQQGMAELNQRVLGEEAAKLGILTAYVTGLNVALVGAPGGGKTTLSAEAYRLVEDIQTEDVARVPHHSDLTPQQLIGGSITTTKEITGEDGTVRAETLTAKIKPIINLDTRVIWLDELNRVNPFAVNGVLGALENGMITTDAGEVKLKGLELAISTMNPTETRQATFPVAAATASRHAIGVIMGNGKHDVAARDNMIGHLIDGWQPGDITPVITTKNLHNLRAAAQNIVVPETQKNLAIQLIRGAKDTLADNHLHEADARITKHMVTIARGMALLKGEERVTEANLREATRFVMTARLGIMGIRGAGDLHAAVDSAVLDVIDHA